MKWTDDPKQVTKCHKDVFEKLVELYPKGVMGKTVFRDGVVILYDPGRVLYLCDQDAIDEARSELDAEYESRDAFPEFDPDTDGEYDHPDDVQEFPKDN